MLAETATARGRMMLRKPLPRQLAVDPGTKIRIGDPPEETVRTRAARAAGKIPTFF